MAFDFATSSAGTQLLAAFNAGLLTSLTPCIYPLIPITLAIFGASSETSRGKSFLLALSYVLGIATTYTMLGLVAAKSGGVFGAFLSNPWAVGVLAALLILLALFSLDALKIHSLSKLQQSASHVGGKGVRGAFLMGTASGFVAAPCAGPMLVLILTFAAAQQNTAWGAVLLFTYAIGMGMLFLVLGLFPGFLKRLPRSGNWLHAVKFLTAALLLMVALFLTQPFHGPTLTPLYSSYANAFFAGGAVGLLGAFLSYRRPSLPARVASALVVAVCGFYIALRPGTHSDLVWQSSIESAVSKAQEKSTLVMVDMFAEWCAACKELDEKTFSAAQVKAKLETLSLTRIDFTLSNDLTEKLSDTYSVAGLPCVLFLDATGKEIPDTRVTGYVKPEAFLQHLQSVITKVSASGNR